MDGVVDVGIGVPFGEVFRYCCYEQYYTPISLFIKENVVLIPGVFLGSSRLRLRVGDR